MIIKDWESDFKASTQPISISTSSGNCSTSTSTSTTGTTSTTTSTVDMEDEITLSLIPDVESVCEPYVPSLKVYIRTCIYICIYMYK